MGRFYGVYDCHLNKNTKNWDGAEWVVDGEYGRMSYPTTMTKEQAIDAYRKKLDEKGNRISDYPAAWSRWWEEE